MYPVMSQEQGGLEGRLIIRLREALVMESLCSLYLGLGLSALGTLVGAEVRPRKAIQELRIELSQDDPLIDVSDMVFLDTFPNVKVLLLGITPFQDAEAGISGIENWSSFDLAGPLYSTEILEAISTRLPAVEGLSLCVSFNELE